MATSWQRQGAVRGPVARGRHPSALPREPLAVSPRDRPWPPIHLSRPSNVVTSWRLLTDPPDTRCTALPSPADRHASASTPVRGLTSLRQEQPPSPWPPGHPARVARPRRPRARPPSMGSRSGRPAVEHRNAPRGTGASAVLRLRSRRPPTALPPPNARSTHARRSPLALRAGPSPGQGESLRHRDVAEPGVRGPRDNPDARAVTAAVPATKAAPRA